MYTNKLLDAYKDKMNYVQYKQIAHDLGVSPQMITEVRKGRTFLNENQILMLADAVGEDKEKALIGLAMDKAKTHEAQTLWQNIGKKFNGLGLSSISMACAGLALVIASPQEPLLQCALCDVMLNNVSYQLHIHPFDYQGIYDELSKK
ncbi:regulatory protein [Vibrio alginolyticus]|nr:regulatory protein [Vibrio alginolyticus]